MAGPHDFPWLGDLVNRERAWRWASQFPQFFATVEAADRDVIRGFIARTLTEVEPPSDLEAAKGKGCCKSKKPPRPPLPPGPDQPGWELVDWWTVWECGPPCQPGYGIERVVYSDGRPSPSSGCVPTDRCPDIGLVALQAVSSPGVP
jgi:hypothetical protein